MKSIDIIDKLSAIQNRLTANQPQKMRLFIAGQDLRKKRGCLVIGPRGVGKTTLLLREAARSHVLYVSTDNPIVASIPLFDLAEAAFGIGYEGLILDEIHFASQWSSQLKAIYDSHPNKKIWASDSSSLLLRRGSADLSRRFPHLGVPLLSFREYLHLKHDADLPSFDPLTASANAFSETVRKINVLQIFPRYLEEGFRPFFVEGDYAAKILGIIEKTIFYDIPFFVPRVQDNHLRLMNAIIGYLATAPIPTLNIDALSRDWSVGKEKLYQLLNVLEHVGLINIVRRPSDFKASGKGAKIFFADPSMYATLSGDLGNIREAFVTTIFRQMGKPIHASADDEKADFVVGKISLEVGGRNKPSKGADFVLRDDLDLPGKKSIPLWSLGMMY